MNLTQIEASRHCVVLTATFLQFHAEGISRGVLWDR